MPTDKCRNNSIETNMILANRSCDFYQTPCLFPLPRQVLPLKLNWDLIYIRHDNACMKKECLGHQVVSWEKVQRWNDMRWMRLEYVEKNGSYRTGGSEYLGKGEMRQCWYRSREIWLSTNSSLATNLFRFSYSIFMRAEMRASFKSCKKIRRHQGWVNVSTDRKW